MISWLFSTCRTPAIARVTNGCRKWHPRSRMCFKLAVKEWGSCGWWEWRINWGRRCHGVRNRRVRPRETGMKLTERSSEMVSETTWNISKGTINNEHDVGGWVVQVKRHMYWLFWVAVNLQWAYWPAAVFPLLLVLAVQVDQLVRCVCVCVCVCPDNNLWTEWPLTWISDVLVHLGNI